MRAPYLAARRVERQGLAALRNASLKEIDPERYNLRYAAESHTILDTVTLNEAYVKNNTIIKEEMISRLKTAPVIILADAYFDTKQHIIFLEIITALAHNDPFVGLEEQLVKLKDNRTAAEKLNYLPVLDLIEEKEIKTFTHGTAGGHDPRGAPGTNDFFSWDSSLAEQVSSLVDTGKQVVVLVGNTHASTDHLPFLIEERAGIDPVLVVQSPLGVTVRQLFQKHASMNGRLAEWGVGEGFALTIDNDFYLNTPLSFDDFKGYIDLFDLQSLLPSP